MNWDTSRAEAQWQTTLASIPSLEATIATTSYRLKRVDRRQPTALSANLSFDGAAAALCRLSMPSVRPEQLLRRRPDVARG